MRDGSAGTGRAAAETWFRSAVQDIFADRCKAAWLSGSFLYKGAEPGRSDIDVVIVVHESEPLPACGDTLERIRRFVDAYLAIHARQGLDPDLDFPTEYVVPATLEQAIAWRGFALDGKVAGEFPSVEDKDYWPGRPDRWFHAWVSMTAFSRFLAGDRDYHERVKLDAWKSVLRFLLLRSDRETMALDDFWPGLAQFGVKPTYQAFWPIEEQWVKRALGELEAAGFVRLAGERAEPVTERLREWERELETAIAAEDEEGPLLLPPELHREIGAYATRRWVEKYQVDASSPA